MNKASQQFSESRDKAFLLVLAKAKTKKKNQYSNYIVRFNYNREPQTTPTILTTLSSCHWRDYTDSAREGSAKKFHVIA